ncbi:lasso RiPP family leader peptide-containing protein [Streptomyces sp. NPDC048643]|uniref:lasso RiPP family leader peptide-containing protein n=1 Tax=Streptomyces sp. NPDC048643 TaxID=3155637 RepID=UPI0034158767
MTYKPTVVSPDGGCGNTPQSAGNGTHLTPGGSTDYEPPMLVDLGHVREVTLGSSPSGNADANAQYYY